MARGGFWLADHLRRHDGYVLATIAADPRGAGPPQGECSLMPKAVVRRGLGLPSACGWKPLAPAPLAPDRCASPFMPLDQFS